MGQRSYRRGARCLIARQVAVACPRTPWGCSDLSGYGNSCRIRCAAVRLIGSRNAVLAGTVSGQRVGRISLMNRSQLIAVVFSPSNRSRIPIPSTKAGTRGCSVRKLLNPDSGSLPGRREDLISTAARIRCPRQMSRSTSAPVFVRQYHNW